MSLPALNNFIRRLKTTKPGIKNTEYTFEIDLGTE